MAEPRNVNRAPRAQRDAEEDAARTTAQQQGHAVARSQGGRFSGDAWGKESPPPQQWGGKEQ